MTVFIAIVLAGVLVIGLGVLILWLMRRSPSVVPDVADRHAARHERAVAVDDEGRPVTAAEAGDDAVEGRDTAAFEDVLRDELDDLRR